MLWALPQPLMSRADTEHRTLTLSTKASVHLTSPLCLLPDVKTVGTTNRNSWSATQTFNGRTLALWIRVSFIFHKDKTFVRDNVQSSVLLKCDAVLIVKRFAMFWRKHLSSYSVNEGSKENPGPLKMASIRKKRKKQTRLPQRHIRVDADPQKHSRWG
jgi:hypothetical protein